MPSHDALLAAATAARERAYAPYSNFAVGAAVETDDGTIVAGCNVENASYSLTICAERVAVARAVAEGHLSFRAIAVSGPARARTAPCGACRQFLAEFGPEISVTYTTPGGVVTTTLAELLPEAFGSRDLEAR